MKREKTRHMPPLLQRAQAAGNLGPRRHFRGQRKRGQKRQIQAKVWACLVSLGTPSFLRENWAAGRYWVWGRLSPCASGASPWFPPGPLGVGRWDETRGLLTAEVDIGLKVNENS